MTGGKGRKPRYVHDGTVSNGPHVHYVRSWKEGRGRNAEVMVQVWLDQTTPEGEPDGDWAMPGVLPVDLAITQAVLQTTKRGGA